MWTVQYTPEAANYVRDNASLVLPLYFAIIELGFNGLDGVKRGRVKHFEENIYLWEVEGHQLFVEQLQEEYQTLVILRIYPPK